MRRHFTEAPPALRRILADHISSVFDNEMSAHVAVNYIHDAGYDLRLEEIPTPLHDRAHKYPDDRALIQMSDSVGWASEEIAITNWHSRRDWAANTSLEADRKVMAEKAASNDASKAAFLKKRTAEILAENRRLAESRANGQALAEYESRHR